MTSSSDRSESSSSGEHRVLVEEGQGIDHPLRGNERRHFDDQPVVDLATGSPMPSLGFGTWELDDDTAGAMVNDAIVRGVRHIDTAQMYGNEAAIGSAIAAAAVDRSELFVTTKVANDKHEPDALVRSVEESLEALGTDHVDLLLVHWPTEWDRVGATLATLAQVQASGLAHHIGVSNFTIEQLDQIEDLAPLEVLQAECHPFFQQQELRRWCVERDWVFTAYSPLARGEVTQNEVLAEIAAAHDATATQIALAWLLAQPRVTTIPRTSNTEHLEDNWAARSIELSEDELDRIERLDSDRRLVDPDFAPW